MGIMKNGSLEAIPANTSAEEMDYYRFYKVSWLVLISIRDPRRVVRNEFGEFFTLEESSHY